jgi:hypothetical protein
MFGNFKATILSGVLNMEFEILLKRSLRLYKRDNENYLYFDTYYYHFRDLDWSSS